MSASSQKGTDALLTWCKRQVAGHQHVEIRNWTTSWQDGMAFCALAHTFFPDDINYATLNPANKVENLDLAFKTLQKHGVEPLLEAQDIAELPEKLSIITYLGCVHRVLSKRIPISQEAMSESESRPTEPLDSSSDTVAAAAATSNTTGSATTTAAENAKSEPMKIGGSIPERLMQYFTLLLPFIIAYAIAYGLRELVVEHPYLAVFLVLVIAGAIAAYIFAPQAKEPMDKFVVPHLKQHLPKIVTWQYNTLANAPKPLRELTEVGLRKMHPSLTVAADKIRLVDEPVAGVIKSINGVQQAQLANKGLFITDLLLQGLTWILISVIFEIIVVAYIPTWLQVFFTALFLAPSAFAMFTIEYPIKDKKQE